MNINFWLDNEEETEITGFYDMPSNPFAVGDVVSLIIEDLVSANYSNHSLENKKRLQEVNEQIKKQFHRQKVRILREGKYVTYNIVSEPKLTIEYHCEIIK